MIFACGGMICALCIGGVSKYSVTMHALLSWAYDVFLFGFFGLRCFLRCFELGVAARSVRLRLGSSSSSVVDSESVISGSGSGGSLVAACEMGVKCDVISSLRRGFLLFFLLCALLGLLVFARWVSSLRWRPLARLSDEVTSLRPYLPRSRGQDGAYF